MDRLMFYPAALGLAFALDLLLGDPRRLPHPVRWIGWGVSLLERVLRFFFKGARAERIGGVLLVLLVAGGGYLASAAALAAAGRLSHFVELALAAYLVYVTVAVKDMGRHVKAVARALREENLPLARTRVALLVSRDCAAMEAGAIAGAALESLFENTADGVAAPLFYAALGGPALAILYKAVNTMDSMVGYKNERYRHFGWAAARLDDLLGYIPARLSALAFLAAGCMPGVQWRRDWAVLMADRRKHDSPNSAWPEAAAAAVLDLRLGGPAVYGGVTVARPYLNGTGRSPGMPDLARGMALFYRTAVLILAAALLPAVGIAAVRGVFL
ncbi:MAG: adenosylcobinamide-phosphate synthase CbiB [Bacillota bacterium]